MHALKLSVTLLGAVIAQGVFADQRQPACLTSPFSSQKACDTSLSIADRVAALIDVLTLEEKAQNLVYTASGVDRIGLPSYNWWSEALHGVAASPGVTFNSPNGSDFSYATSFPMPISMGAAFDDELIYQAASIIGKEARAFANYEQSGFDFWTPNINTFLDPRWGRGMETPGEDSFHAQRYVAQLIPGLQGGADALDEKQIIATCKHFAVYDVETNRYGRNYNPTQQDLGEYYLTPFKTCVRDAHVGSIMCSYNAVDGVPACASEYLLSDTLRKDYNFTQPYNYVTSDCDAVANIYDSHGFVDSSEAAAAVAINAGTDMDCGGTYLDLVAAVEAGYTSNSTLDQALTRLYTALFTVGYFDGQAQYDGLSFADVSTPDAQALAYRAAWEGMALLKNDNGALPLQAEAFSRVALIGPWAEAAWQMQGNYFGTAPYLHSPLEAVQAQWGTENVEYVLGTNITSSDTSGFAAALAAADAADLVLYAGGIDTTVEFEGGDRSAISWPGNQLDLVAQLAARGKPVVVVRFGGGSLDDSSLLANANVSALLWAGYPGQDGGYAVVDVLVGKQAPAGRLTTTQYPADYINEVDLFDPAIRPNSSFPGRTYKWYTGTPVLEFGYGLHYTTFGASWATAPEDTYAIESLVAGAENDAAVGLTVSASVSNTGNTASDFVGLLFLSTQDAGPTPYPGKWLVSYERAHDLQPGTAATLSLPVTLGSLARASPEGDLTIYPGTYQLTLDVDEKLSVNFTLTGEATVVNVLPRQQSSYNYTVPVNPQS